MNNSFVAAINQICDEKNIDHGIVIEAIEASLAAAYRKDYGTEFQKIKARFDENTGMMKLYQIKEVVKDVEHEDSEMSLKEAKKKNKKLKVGDTVKIDVTPKNQEGEKFGRIAAQTAKQVIIQRLQEAEREAIFNRYKDRVGEIVNARVQRVEHNIIFIELENTTTITIEHSEQIPGEKYFNGQMMKVYIAEVRKTTKGPAIIVSRTHPKFIEGLLMEEVPEVKEGTVIIKGIAREAGVRTKLSVTANQEGVDPVGSCVGQRGVRIQNITSELADEKIDVIEHSDDMVTMIMNTLAPAKITSIQLDEKTKRAKVYVMTDQRSLAIGRNGQNVRLASKLIGWEIDVLDFIAGETGGEMVDAEVEEETEVRSQETVEAPVVETPEVEEEVVEEKAKEFSEEKIEEKVEEVAEETPEKEEIKEDKPKKKPAAKKASAKKKPATKKK